MFAFSKKSQPEPKKNLGRERRQHKRVDKNFILKYFDLSHPKEKHEITQLKNISQGGLCFISSIMIAVNSKLGIELKTPYISTTTYLQGIVLESHDKVAGILYETRLRFENLDNQSSLILKELMEYISNTEAKDI